MNKNLIRLMRRIQGKKFIHFLHIGKTGGTAIKYALKDHHCQHSPYIIYLHGHGITLKDIPRGDKVIFFLRNPISRFISGFYSRQRQGKPRHFFPWCEEEKVAFQYFSTVNQLGKALSSEDETIREKATMAMKNIRHVKTSYWDWFDNEDYFLSRKGDIFFIGFQEQLTKDFEIMKGKLNLAPHVILPQDDINCHRSPSSLDRTLDEEAIFNLEKWYHKDFLFVELCQKMSF